MCMHFQDLGSSSYSPDTVRCCAEQCSGCGSVVTRGLGGARNIALTCMEHSLLSVVGVAVSPLFARELYSWGVGAEVCGVDFVSQELMWNSEPGVSMGVPGHSQLTVYGLSAKPAKGWACLCMLSSENITVGVLDLGCGRAGFT
jgi:hypothetical protein